MELFSVVIVVVDAWTYTNKPLQKNLSKISGFINTNILVVLLQNGIYVKDTQGLFIISYNCM